MWSRSVILAVLALTAVPVGCTEEPDAACRVTRPGVSAPFASEGFNHGNSMVGVGLWPDGTLVAGPLPEGGSYAEIKPDGSIEAKVGWWRAVEGRLSIEGKRLDASAPPLRAEIPHGYGTAGFQPSGLIFPTEGCWRVVGSVGDARLAFVVRVVSVNDLEPGAV